MKDETIRVGDLVMVVHVHCPHYTQGLPFIVGFIGRAHGICHGCRVSLGAHTYAATADGRYTTPVSWLKKIHPPALDQSTERKEEITV